MMQTRSSKLLTIPDIEMAGSRKEALLFSEAISFIKKQPKKKRVCFNTNVQVHTHELDELPQHSLWWQPTQVNGEHEMEDSLFSFSLTDKYSVSFYHLETNYRSDSGQGRHWSESYRIQWFHYHNKNFWKPCEMEMGPPPAEEWTSIGIYNLWIYCGQDLAVESPVALTLEELAVETSNSTGQDESWL
jgi:hypothetical protein